MIRDIRYAVRTLRRTPVFLAMAVATLGLGIGATTAIFSLFYQVLLRDLPVKDSEQLVVLHQDSTPPGRSSSDNFESVFSDPLYLRLRDRAGAAMQGLIARSSAQVNIMRNGSTGAAQAEIVSGNFFQVLGVRPFAGRLLAPQDDTMRGGNDVTVLGYAYRQQHFGTANVIGQKIRINGHPFEIVGITPPEFHGVLSGQTPALYMTISMTGIANPDFRGFDNPSWHWLTLIGRLRPGVARSQAEAALNPLFTSILRDELGALHVRSAHARDRILANHLGLRPAASGLNALERSWRKPLLVLIGAAGGLLLIACSNLAGLLMVRAAARQREIAIRLSLGATRPQVVSQLLAESLLVAILGSVEGILLSFLLTRGILHLLPPDITGGWVGSGLDWHVLAFTLTISIAAGLAFGMLPAWQASTGYSASALKDEGRQVASGLNQTFWRKALVGFEIALCVVLLAGAGLFSKSLSKLLLHNPGFHAENLLSFNLDPSLNRYTNAQALNLYSQIRSRLSQLPGVTAVSFCQLGPYSNSDASTNVSIEGYRPTEDENMDSSRNLVAPGFFHTLGVPILKGREFTDADVRGTRKVAVVNEAFVKRFLRGKNPLGTHMSVGAGPDVPIDIEIVGVVPNAQLASLREVPKPFYYLPFLQTGDPKDPAEQAVFLTRSASDDSGLPGAARRIVHSLDGNLPVGDIEKMQVQIRNSVYQDRAVAVLTSASGVLALLLASLGLYGVIAYAVSRRTAEIGIRMALGADRGSILSLVLREVLWMILIGALAGVAGALALGHAIASQLFGVQPVDVAVFGMAIGALIAVAVAAGAAPTVRAMRVDPMQALRYN